MTPAFDSVVVVDWSGGNQRLARPCKDAIWIGEAGRDPVYCRHRGIAEDWLRARFARAVAQGERLLVGVDFPLGYPAGFTRALTGADDPLAVWDWLESRIEDSPRANNRFQVAAEINRRLGGGRGPFWGNALRADVAGLPRTKRDYVNPFPDRRRCEVAVRGVFTCWQLAGAGSVGSQVLMGLPVLHRLRRDFPGRIAVWQFEPVSAPVVIAEIWPGLIEPAVKAATGPGGIRDAVQVRLLSAALSRLPPRLLGDMLAATDPEEGAILGAGFEQELLHACP